MHLRYALLAAIAAGPCLAQDSGTPLEAVTVTATGRELPARDVLAGVIVILREDIERTQATDLADLLRLHAGIELGRNGGPGAVTSVFVRGGESNHTLVLVDGVRVNPSTSGGAALQNITPGMIERVEIVKGPRATLYGSDAIAAVINVITRAPAGSAVELRARAGTYRTSEAGAFIAAGDGRRGVALHAQHLASDGFAPLESGGPDRGTRNSAANLRAQTALGAARLDAQAWHSQGTSEYQGFSGPQDQDFVNQTLALGARLPLEAWDFGGRISQMQDRVGQNQSTDFVRTRRAALALDATRALAAGQRLTAGLEAAREEVDALLFGSQIEERRDLASAHLQYELSAGAHALLAAIGGTDHDAFGSQVTGNLEYGYALTGATQLVAAAGTGFRAPDATDRYGFGGNPQLEPERARNLELALRQQLGPRQRAELRLFRSDVEDLISVECVANCFDADFFNDEYRAVNVDQVRIEGAELNWQFDPRPWQARVSLVYQEPRSTARPDPCSGGERLCRRADASASASLAWLHQRGQLGLDLLGIGDRVDFGGSALPGYALVGAGGLLRVGAQFSLGLRIENLLDRDYQTVDGYRQPGRAGYVTVSWRR